MATVHGVAELDTTERLDRAVEPHPQLMQLAFISHILHAMHCAKLFTYII